MKNPIQAFPLTWPAGWRRMATNDRKYGHFSKKETSYYTDWQQKRQSRVDSKSLSVADGVGRILESLGRMGVDRQDIIISSNVRTRLDGMPRSGEPEPKDPGASVYWREHANKPMRCMAIDRYTVVADNLAAIAATLEAMRAIERHGGAEILDRAFTGFKALASENTGPSWWSVLEVEATASEAEINAAYRKLARFAHPDNKDTGSDEAIRALNIARDQGIAAAKGRA